MDKAKLAELEKWASEYAKISNRYFNMDYLELSCIREAIEKVWLESQSTLVCAVMENLGYEFIEKDWGERKWIKK